MPFEVLQPTFDEVVRNGFALNTGGRLWLTQAGIKQVNTLSAAIVGRIVDKLAQSPSFVGRPDRVQVDAALERIAHRMLVQRDWTDDPKVLVGAR